MARRHSIKIHGHSWKYALISDKEYEKYHPIDSAAVTYTDCREVYFKQGSLKFMYVVHELVHCYSTALCLEDTTEISLFDYEEVYATFFSKYGINIIQDAIQIYTKFIVDEKLINTFKKIKLVLNQLKDL